MQNKFTRFRIWNQRKEKVLKVVNKTANDEDRTYHKKSIKVFINILKSIKDEILNIRKEL